MVAFAGAFAGNSLGLAMDIPRLVQFRTQEQAAAAIRQLNKSRLGGRQLTVREDVQVGAWPFLNGRMKRRWGGAENALSAQPREGSAPQLERLIRVIM
jgi:hypothetical protein